jgi:hypothetical protein
MLCEEKRGRLSVQKLELDIIEYCRYRNKYNYYKRCAESIFYYFNKKYYLRKKEIYYEKYIYKLHFIENNYKSIRKSITKNDVQKNLHVNNKPLPILIQKLFRIPSPNKSLIFDN